MAEAVYCVLYLDLDIKLKFECVTAGIKYKRIHKGTIQGRKSVSK